MNTEAPQSKSAFKAAQYVRMSTEHQQYSTQNQADKIQEYADKRGIEIVKTYADEGKSGLSIGGRAALHLPCIYVTGSAFCKRCPLSRINRRANKVLKRPIIE